MATFTHVFDNQFIECNFCANKEFLKYGFFEDSWGKYMILECPQCNSYIKVYARFTRPMPKLVRIEVNNEKK